MLGSSAWWCLKYTPFKARLRYYLFHCVSRALNGASFTIVSPYPAQQTSQMRTNMNERTLRASDMTESSDNLSRIITTTSRLVRENFETIRIANSRSDGERPKTNILPLLEVFRDLLETL